MNIFDGMTFHTSWSHFSTWYKWRSLRLIIHRAASVLHCNIIYQYFYIVFMGREERKRYRLTAFMFVEICVNIYHASLYLCMYPSVMLTEREWIVANPFFFWCYWCFLQLVWSERSVISGMYLKPTDKPVGSVCLSARTV